MWNNTKHVYFWMHFTRVTGKAGNHKFYASTGTDSETLGRFDASVTRVGYTIVNYGEKSEDAFQRYKTFALAGAEAMGYTNNQIVAIRRSEYKAFVTGEAREVDDFDEQFRAPAYQGKRTVRK